MKSAMPGSSCGFLSLLFELFVRASEAMQSFTISLHILSRTVAGSTLVISDLDDFLCGVFSHFWAGGVVIGNLVGLLHPFLVCISFSIQNLLLAYIHDPLFFMGRHPCSCLIEQGKQWLCVL